ncbi:MAG: hypothetical protein MJ224_02625 [archaeon]|nr:hypothetical protein [archaeon]
MRFGILKYDNGEIVKVPNLDKKLPKETRQYEILEESEDASKINELYNRYLGKKEKPKLDPPFGSVEYNKKFGIKYLGVKNPFKYCILLRKDENIPDNIKEDYILTDSYEKYIKWYYDLV